MGQERVRKVEGTAREGEEVMKEEEGLSYWNGNRTSQLKKNSQGACLYRQLS